MKRLISIIIAALLPLGALHGSSYGRFRSAAPQGGKVTSVFAIVQEGDGPLWMGTDDGLLRYDGYLWRQMRHNSGDSLSLPDNIVGTLAYDAGRGLLIAGTDSGLCLYDPVQDTFCPVPGSASLHIKSVLSEGDSLYAATTTGLYLFSQGKAERLLEGHFTSVRKIFGSIWAASYGCLMQLSAESSTWKRHPIGGDSSLVLDICPAADGSGNLWAGSESGLCLYDPQRGLCLRHLLENIPIKTFHYHGSTLWMGTDNGAATLESDGSILFFRHDVSDPGSIPNNVVWAVAEDAAGNLWFGTDHGAASVFTGRPYRFTRIDRITGSTDGMDIGVMAPGSDGSLWMGGRGGLICSREDLGGGFILKADAPSPHGRLSHNKVRDLYDDGASLWIASDGGLDRYDYASGRIENCRIAESSGLYSPNWMYAIAEDGAGRLCLGTYDGGLFVVDKHRLCGARGAVMCEKHFSRTSSPALKSDIIRDLIFRDGRLYVIYSDAIDVMDSAMETLQRVEMPAGTFIITARSGEGRLWIGTDRALFSLSDSLELQQIGGLEAYIIALDICGGKVWAAGRSTLASYDPSSGLWEHFPAEGMPLMSVCHAGGRMYFGTVDGVLEFSQTAAAAHAPARLRISELFAGEERIRPGVKYDGKIILEADAGHVAGIVLPHSLNSFALAVSAYTFGGSDEIVLCRLRGFDNSWRPLGREENKASFINVPPGRYTFEYRGDGTSEADASSIEVRITPPWYASYAAYALYALLAAALLLAALRYWKIRNRLLLEHRERERAIAMANSKSEFLSNVVHDFKSPLSIILGFLANLKSRESDSLKTRELEAVAGNAQKMNLLLHKMAEFNADGSSMLFVPTPVALGEFAREVWDSYAQAFADKGISGRFSSEELDYLFLVDKVQMSSALGNLLSNALKFTPSGGSVLMAVRCAGGSSDMYYAEITVEDTGCGIRKEDLPKVFNRYWCADSLRGINPGGSGIGLDIAKKAVELHKGRISVTSEEGRGSRFTVQLSTMKSDTFTVKKSSTEELSMLSLSQVWQHDRKPIILLVEDNADIRDLIVASLGKDYVFVTAGNGEEGLAALKGAKVDLVVTDIAMPVMDGLTMSRRIRGALETAFLPIIVLTGKDDAQTRISSYEYADAFIAKPFDLNWLGAVIIRLLIKHEQYLDKVRRQKLLSGEGEAAQSPDEDFLKEMMDIVARHLDDSAFSAAALAEESHWSQKQVYRKIKVLTGKTVPEFIRDVRLDKAEAYLSQGSLTVKEVMYKVGFTSPSYFTKCFKERFGRLPSEKTV